MRQSLKKYIEMGKKLDNIKRKTTSIAMVHQSVLNRQNLIAIKEQASKSKKIDKQLRLMKKKNSFFLNQEFRKTSSSNLVPKQENRQSFSSLFPTQMQTQPNQYINKSPIQIKKQNMSIKNTTAQEFLVSTQVTSTDRNTQFRMNSQPNQIYENASYYPSKLILQDEYNTPTATPMKKISSNYGKFQLGKLPLNEIFKKRTFSVSNQEFTERNSTDRKKISTRQQVKNLQLKGPKKMFSDPKTYREFQLNCLDSQLKKVFWHRSKIHQNQPAKSKRKTISSPQYNFQAVLDKNLIYTESGTKAKIIQQAYISTTRSKFDPIEIQKRNEFLKSNRLSLKQQSLFFRVRKNDFLYILKNQKRYNPEDLIVKDNSGQTPLHYAIKNGHKEVSQVLLRMGSNVNEKNSQGNTPLHIAFMNNSYQMANLLMTRNAEVQIFNNENKTPIYYANKQLIQKFPHLKNSICSRERVGDLNLDLHMPQLYTSRFKEYSPLYRSDSVNCILKIKEQYIDKFKNLKKPTASQIVLHSLSPITRKF